MRLGSLLVTVVGLGLAAGAVWVAQDINGEAPTAAIANPDPDLIKIFVARSDIGFGETIDQHDVQLVDWPRSALLATTDTFGCGELSPMWRATLVRSSVLRIHRMSQRTGKECSNATRLGSLIGSKRSTATRQFDRSRTMMTSMHGSTTRFST